MKRRLFWKILLAFWLTFFLMTQGIWHLVALSSDRSEPSDYARASARMAVAAASNSISLGGQERYDVDLQSWPRDMRHQLHISQEQVSAESSTALEQAVVASPSGTRYRVFYDPRSPSWRRSPPREVVIAGVIGGLLFSALLAWYLTLPVERMRAGFRRLAQGDFATRLVPSMGRRRDEIADLARDFDQMAMQLNELVAARDRLLADVSHELRTPLARLNVAIGLARQDPSKLEASLERISSESVKLDTMVGELLTLSKLESDARPAEEYFDLAQIVDNVVQDATFEATPKQVAVNLEVNAFGDQEWLTKGNGLLMNRAVENIVRNAIRYSPQGGHVRVALHRDVDVYRLTIADSGPGVPSEDIGRLFKPFSQSTDGLGFGLGLAIAQRAIVVMGGTIVARNQDGGGLEMTVTIPSAA